MVLVNTTERYANWSKRCVCSGFARGVGCSMFLVVSYASAKNTSYSASISAVMHILVSFDDDCPNRKRLRLLIL